MTSAIPCVTCSPGRFSSDPEAPAAIALNLDHAEDPTHGQQEFSFRNPYSQSHGDLPLFLFAGLSGRFIAAALRPGKRPTAAEYPV